MAPLSNNNNQGGRTVSCKRVNGGMQAGGRGEQENWQGHGAIRFRAWRGGAGRDARLQRRETSGSQQTTNAASRPPTFPRLAHALASCLDSGFWTLASGVPQNRTTKTVTAVPGPSCPLRAIGPATINQHLQLAAAKSPLPRTE
ncbi:hypothetical protein VTN96DRAFT_4878 [Rasamsonia emersonii]